MQVHICASNDAWRGNAVSMQYYGISKFLPQVMVNFSLPKKLWLSSIELETQWSQLRAWKSIVCNSASTSVHKYIYIYDITLQGIGSGVYVALI